MIKFTTNKEGQLKDLIKDEFPEMSGRKAKNLIQYSQIKVDGTLLKHPTDSIPAGSEVVIEKHSKPKMQYPFKVYFEDEFYMIVEKPAGILSSSPPGTPEESVFLLMNHVHREETSDRLYPVHRLDREVGGLMVIAKTEEVQQFFKDNWYKGRKKYYALVEGIPRKTEDKIVTWLYEDARKIVRSSHQEEPDSKKAITHYKVLETNKRLNNALLEIELETGRKNQIRVHMQTIGHPIIGDWRYGADSTIKRQVRLYAYYLELPHPEKKRNVRIERPLPGFFRKFPMKDEKYK